MKFEDQVKCCLLAGMLNLLSGISERSAPLAIQARIATDR